ncbi:MAG: hybrid sensor histidine kinase/response regulator [Actinomycetota bacterium]
MAFADPAGAAPDLDSPVPRALSVDDTSLRIALLEDDAVDVAAITRALATAWPAGVDVRTFERLTDLEDGLRRLHHDVIFTDLAVQDGDGIDLLRRVVTFAGPTPVVVLTGSDDPVFPVLALELGAQDYLIKGAYDAELLGRTLRYSMARSRSDEAVRQLAFELKVANADLEECLGIMAHDLRAPLRTSRLFADRLVALADPGEEAMTMAAALDTGLDRMETMIERLLRLATLREGDVRPIEEPLSVAVSDATGDLLGGPELGGATIEVVRDGVVLADPALLRALLRELVNNCIRFRSPDRPLVVRISAEAIGSTSAITVGDNGVGLEPEYRQRVFRLFERLDPSLDGLGFGLAFARRIVELHRGTIALGSPPDGPGLESRIRLPVAA